VSERETDRQRVGGDGGARRRRASRRPPVFFDPRACLFRPSIRENRGGSGRSYAASYDIPTPWAAPWPRARGSCFWTGESGGCAVYLGARGRARAGARRVSRGVSRGTAGALSLERRGWLVVRFGVWRLAGRGGRSGRRADVAASAAVAALATTLLPSLQKKARDNERGRGRPPIPSHRRRRHSGGGARGPRGVQAERACDARATAAEGRRQWGAAEIVLLKITALRFFWGGGGRGVPLDRARG
jgi:hypothetical protein